MIGDYLIIKPKKAIEYSEKQYGAPIINNFDKDLLLILGEWFKKHAKTIKKLMQTGQI